LKQFHSFVVRVVATTENSWCTGTNNWKQSVYQYQLLKTVGVPVPTTENSRCTGTNNWKQSVYRYQQND